MKTTVFAALFAALIFALAAPARAHEPAAAGHDDAAAIRALLHGMFDRPDAALVIEPVVTAGGFAVAGWTQGPMGGRAFLRQEHGHWMLVLCAGDEIIAAAALAASGVPADTAPALAAAIAAAEKDVDPARLALFASFGGVVMMDGAAPAHHK